MERKEQTWDAFSLLALGRSFWECRLFLTAVDLDVFTLLSVAPITAAEFASQKGTDLRGTTMLLDALTALQLLDKRQAQYQLKPSVAPYLVSDSKDSIIPMAQHAAHLWKVWSDLTEVVRTGVPPSVNSGTAFSEEEYKSFILAMQVVGKGTAESIVEALNVDGRKNLLDIGGASGSYTSAFLKRHPNMTATLFDLPQVIPAAREYLTQEGVIERARLCAGDFYVDELPGGHDVALLSAIIHQNSRQQNRDLYAKTFRALVPGGCVIIRDHVMDSTRTQPVAGALFAINMLVATPAGGTYTFDETREDLQLSGFENVELAQADERMNGIITAIRP